MVFLFDLAQELEFAIGCSGLLNSLLLLVYHAVEKLQKLDLCLRWYDLLRAATPRNLRLVKKIFGVIMFSITIAQLLLLLMLSSTSG